MLPALAQVLAAERDLLPADNQSFVPTLGGLSPSPIFFGAQASAWAPSFSFWPALAKMVAALSGRVAYLPNSKRRLRPGLPAHSKFLLTSCNFLLTSCNFMLTSPNFMLTSPNFMLTSCYFMLTSYKFMLTSYDFMLTSCYFVLTSCKRRRSFWGCRFNLWGCRLDFPRCWVISAGYWVARGEIWVFCRHSMQFRL